jgi:regulator of ribonuclease activity A
MAGNGCPSRSYSASSGDVDALSRIDFAVKALGSNRPRSDKYGTGCNDAVVSFGRVSFAPVHWLYTDADGILVSSRALHL